MTRDRDDLLWGCFGEDFTQSRDVRELSDGDLRIWAVWLADQCPGMCGSCAEAAEEAVQEVIARWQTTASS